MPAHKTSHLSSSKFDNKIENRKERLFDEVDFGVNHFEFIAITVQ